MMLAPYIVLGVIAICGLTWAFSRILYPIPIRFERSHDDPPETETRIDQLLRNAGE